MKLFKEYRKEVIDAFLSKKAAGRLPLILVEPTPAGLRNQCLERYKIANSPNDEESLKLFFGSKGEATDYHRLIETTDIDKFRPLMNFLNNLSINTNNKNIELLAYLIDFEPRPFQFRYKAQEESLPPSTSAPKPFEKDLTEVNKEQDQHLPKKQRFHRALSSTVGTRVVLRVAVVVTMAIVSMAIALKPNYMYWTGEEYKRVFFWTGLKEAKLVSFDEKLFRGFKRITQPDTIKKRDIYDIWYTKITRDSIEFYTDSAAHPLDTTKTLKPMTEYIWITWVVNKVSEK